MVRRIVLYAFFLSMLCVPSAQATSIFIPDGVNGMVAVAFNPDGGDPPPDSVVVDIEGTATGSVVDTVGPSNLGPAAATALVAPNVVELSTGTPAALNVTFNFASAIFADGGVLQIPGIGTPVVLDSALAGFVGAVTGVFSFLQATPVEDPLGSVDLYQLVAIIGPEPDVTAVPEPASMTLVGLGIAAAAARRRARKRNA